MPASLGFGFAHQMDNLTAGAIRHDKKMGPPLGTGSPGRRVSDASVVFTPARGVIHPSFPLRGRWSTIRSNRKQAPSPSLAIRAVRLLLRAHDLLYARNAPTKNASYSL